MIPFLYVYPIVLVDKHIVKVYVNVGTELFPFAGLRDNFRKQFGTKSCRGALPQLSDPLRPEGVRNIRCA
jgi:hypothetical protein